jgi:hypothetical protein
MGMLEIERAASARRPQKGLQLGGCEREIRSDLVSRQALSAPQAAGPGSSAVKPLTPTERFKWLGQIAMDPALSALALRIGMRIVETYLQSDPKHPDCGWAWPSQERLARDFGVSVEGVRKALLQLRGKHLYVRKGSGCGRGNSTRYAPRLKSAGVQETPDASRAFPDEIPQPAVGVSDDKPRTQVGPLGKQKPPTAVAETPNFRSEKPPTSVGTNPGDDFYPGILGSARANQRAPKAQRPAELPINFPTEQDMLWAASRISQVGVRVDLEAEAERFRDHHLGKDSRSADWSATWRIWLSRAASFAEERQNRQITPRALDRKSAIAWAMEDQR